MQQHCCNRYDTYYIVNKTSILCKKVVEIEIYDRFLKLGNITVQWNQCLQASNSHYNTYNIASVTVTVACVWTS